MGDTMLVVLLWLYAILAGSTWWINDAVFGVSPEITANLLEPCSSLAILSASSISIIPKPYRRRRVRGRHRGLMFAYSPNTMSLILWLIFRKKKHLQLLKESCFFCVLCNHLMLELAGVAAADRDDTAIDVELSDDGSTAFQLGTEGLRGAAAQTQQANQDVLLRILVGKECLPAAISHIVPPHQLHLSTQASLLMYGLVTWKTPFSSNWSPLFTESGCRPLPGKVWLYGGSPECPLLWFLHHDTAQKETKINWQIFRLFVQMWNWSQGEPVHLVFFKPS